MPMTRKYSKRQKENLAKIPSDFKKAYYEYLESEGGLRKSHFMQYSLNEKTGAPSKKKGRKLGEATEARSGEKTLGTWFFYV